MVTKAKTKDPVIDAEEMISEITDELKKVEKVSKQLEKANTRSESLIEMTGEVVKQSKALQAKGNEIFTKMEDIDFPSRFDKLDKRIEDSDKQILKNHAESFKEIKALDSDIKSVGAELNKNIFEVKGGLISKIEDNEKRIIDGQNGSFKKIEEMLLKKQKRDMLLYLTVIGLLIILLITNMPL
ncbi:MAG: hypothetical protein KKA79_10445 [Nanoarchaeota archaeon]|nr:hypothetical protein [Nanoarchaeota archaeon]